MAEREWTQDDIDEEVFGYDDPEDCDCVHADIDILEGRGHCPACGRSWYLTADELKSELKINAELCEAIAEEHESTEPVSR